MRVQVIGSQLKLYFFLFSEPGIVIKGDPTQYNNTTCSERNDIKDSQNTSVGFCTPIHQTTGL